MIHEQATLFTRLTPIRDAATFVVRESSHPLLLNILALGSLFVGAKDALPKGEALWRLAHIAVATNWKHLMATKGPRDSCEGVQLLLTAVLGQTYALMSKNESLRMTSQIFHGLGFYWARQCGMLNADQTAFAVPDIDAPENEKVESWKRWAAIEVQNRAVLGHYVLDGHISQFSGFAACARHATNPLHMPASEAAFDSSTADEWIQEMHRANTTQISFREVFLAIFSFTPVPNDYSHLSNFTVRVLLEGLQSLAAELQEADGKPALGTPLQADIAGALIRIYNNRLSCHELSSVDQMELVIRWHSICLDLATPSTLLCRKMCAVYEIDQRLHGAIGHDLVDLDLVTWSQSTDALRSLLHCLAIQSIVEKMPIGRLHAIHLPAAIFAVATIYSARCIGGFPLIAYPKVVRWEAVWHVHVPATQSTDDFVAQSMETDAYLQSNFPKAAPNSSTKNLMYELNSLQITLSSISSRWGVSHEMDRVLHRWISIANEKHPS